MRSLAATLPPRGLGLIVDIVPNHMAADAANAWWADVLRHGRASRYARYFDIDWEAGDKVLLPILGKPLQEALAAGEIEVGQETLRYFPSPAACARQRGFAARRAGTPALSPRLVAHRRRLHQLAALLRHQRTGLPAHGGAGSLRSVHALPLRLHAEGLIDGLRIDHVDGLTDPAGYCRTLRRRLGEGAWLVVEKILLRGETLPRDWACDGTTGYDFMNDVSALQHDASGEAPLAAAWASLSGRPAEFAPEEQAARREIVARSFSAQLEACAAALPPGEIARPTLRRVLTELLAHFPVYRTYGADGAFSPVDRAVLQQAADGARRDLPCHRPLGRRRGAAPVRLSRRQAGHGALSATERASRRQGRRGHRLLSLRPAALAQRCRLRRRQHLPSTPRHFHARDAARAAGHPHAMLATATHDHKRGEDVRARLAVLSGMAEEWARLQAGWVEASKSLCTDDAPAAGDVAMLLQTIVGAWPIDLDPGDRAGRTEFAERLAAWQQKALREAKLCSDWAAVGRGLRGRRAPLRSWR